MVAKNIYKKALKILEKQGERLKTLSQNALKHSDKKVALAPGTLVYIGEARTEPPKVSLIDYDTEHVTEVELDEISKCLELKNGKSVSWVNIDGVHQVSLIEEVGKHFGIHPLVLEDIVHTNQRAKVEDYDDYLYIVLKMFYFTSQEKTVQCEQVSLILGKGYLFSFQEKPGDVFNPIRVRIRNGKGRIRFGGSDYLAYALIDAIVDHYFVVLERMGEKLEMLEAMISNNPESSVLNEIHKIKRELVFVRKSIWPMREVVNQFLKGDLSLVQEGTLPYLKDVYDHTIQVIETVESLHDAASGLQDLYMTMISNRMNEVMKVLTIIATIFIPPTFVAGIYGMNFDHMPELHSKNGYFVALGVMMLSISSMLVYFRKKKWL